HEVGSLAFEFSRKGTALFGHLTPRSGEHSRLNGCPVSLDHYNRTSSSDGQEKYYSIRLKGARIAHINAQSPHAVYMNDADPQEHVTIRYRDIIWEHIAAGTSAYSSWESSNE
ncbi:type VI secretion system tube protein Hcp, partial [Pseudomonas lundensis]|uniref:type VI secretion system tube protein TssD n=1 Tax=Pseudomonas lundensis TaxID=86185 RepID=UPI001476149C